VDEAAKQKLLSVFSKKPAPQSAPDDALPDTPDTLDPTDLPSLVWWVYRYVVSAELPVASSDIQVWLDKLDLSWRQFRRAAGRRGLEAHRLRARGRGAWGWALLGVWKMYASRLRATGDKCPGYGRECGAEYTVRRKRDKGSKGFRDGLCWSCYERRRYARAKVKR
jgi:hypothetical protein